MKKCITDIILKYSSSYRDIDGDYITRIKEKCYDSLIEELTEFTNEEKKKSRQDGIDSVTMEYSI